MKLKKRTRNLYSSTSTEPYKISRSSIELFVNCPRCFYLDRKMGVGRPPGFPFNLNSAVDELLKKEFDLYRKTNSQHPLMQQYKIDAIPFAHNDLDKWRENFVGLQFLHKKTNFIITGAVDDLWIDKNEHLIVVDYKSTSKSGEIITLDEEWHQGYKRQMEVYQWLLRKLGFNVSNNAYWVYANGLRTEKMFNATLKFDLTIVPYIGDDGWVENKVIELKKCLDSEEIPEPIQDCDYCAYIYSLNQFFN